MTEARNSSLRTPNASGQLADDTVVELARTFAEEVASAMAQRLAEMMKPRGNRPWTVREVAEHYSVTDSWVYAHWRQLGGFKLGDGRCAPLRFDPERLPGQRPPDEPKPERRPPRRRRTLTSVSAPLTPRPRI
jgi:hypothetical protein